MVSSRRSEAQPGSCILPALALAAEDAYRKARGTLTGDYAVESGSIYVQDRWTFTSSQRIVPYSLSQIARFPIATAN